MGSLSLIQNVMARDELLKPEIKMSFIRKEPPWGFLSLVHNLSCADSELCCVLSVFLAVYTALTVVAPECLPWLKK